MCKLIMFASFFLLCISCKETSSDNKPTEKIDTLNISELIQGLATTSTTKEDVIRPNCFDFKGKIDDKYEIDLRFSYDETDYEYALKKDLKLEIFGSYKYKTSKEGMTLVGEVDFNSKTILLNKIKEKNIDEIFIGKYTDGYSTIEGTWEKVKKGTKLPFVIQKTSLNKKALQLYAETLQKLTYNNGVERIELSGVGVDEKGIFIKEISGAGNYNFSNTSFSGTCSYSQDGGDSYGRSSDYSIDVKIINFKDANQFIVKAEEFSGNYEWEGEDDDYEETNSEVKINEVWMLINNSPIDIFVENKDTINNLAYKAYEGKDGLFVVDNKKNIRWKFDANENMMIQE